jgi:hypothetical protein
MQQVGSLGYLVLTIPPEVRANYRTKKALGQVGTAVKRLLKRGGFSRGLRRWHFFGDQVGQEPPQYHPHLNCLVEGGHVSKSKLEALKRGCAAILGVPVERVNLRYRYATTVPAKLHRIKYVLRSTFKNWRWDPGLAHELVGFRNSSWWGRWEDQPAWEIPEGEERDGCHELRQVGELEKGRCPFDGSRIEWGKGMLVELLLDPRWSKIGGGYWRRE